MSLERTIAGVRLAQTDYGDSLQLISLRELGDASRWPELVALNQLLPPFITDDPTAAGDGIIVTGGLIKIPASASSTVSVEQNSDLVFECDLVLDQGQLQSSSGDFAAVAGIPNLRQALANRLTTDTGELGFHAEYGSRLRRIVGTVNGPTAGLLAASYAKTAVLQDARVSRVTSSVATVLGDQVQVSVVAEPIVGQAVDVTQTV